jgi:hypothetical protein
LPFTRGSRSSHCGRSWERLMATRASDVSALCARTQYTFVDISRGSDSLSWCAPVSVTQLHVHLPLAQGNYDSPVIPLLIGHPTKLPFISRGALEQNVFYLSFLSISLTLSLLSSLAVRNPTAAGSTGCSWLPCDAATELSRPYLRVRFTHEGGPRRVSRSSTLPFQTSWDSLVSTLLKLVLFSFTFS